MTYDFNLFKINLGQSVEFAVEEAYKSGKADYITELYAAANYVFPVSDAVAEVIVPVSEVVSNA